MRKNRTSEYVTDSMLYDILIRVNQYDSFTSLIIRFDNDCKDENKVLEIFSRVNDDEPIQYVFNEYFYKDMKFYVDKNVLIPRPETEELINETIGIIRANKLPRANIVDFCTGSGLIAISLKNEFKESNVFGTDISKEAINIAKRNAKQNTVEVHFLVGDSLNPIIECKHKFDVLISNPPYVENKDDIEKNVLKYEPINAIYCKDGTFFYEEVFKNFNRIMNEKFLLAFEINHDQEEKLTKLIYKYFNTSKTMYRFQKDSFGKTRFLFILGGYDNDEDY